MTMTLQEAHDWLVEVRRRNAVNTSLDDLDDHDAEAVIQAIDAHIAAMGELIGYVHPCYLGGDALAMEVSPVRLSDQQVPVYLASPASGDWDKVREVIADLRRCQSREHALRIADRLAAALPESQPAQDTDVKDAARYRWLRDTPWLGTSLEPVIAQQRNAHWDAAIDAAMARRTTGD